MKTRKGFVSNSSSSNFIIALAHKPTSVVDTQAMLFDKDQTIFPDPYKDCGYPVVDVAERVFQDLRKAEPLDIADILECLESGYISEIYNTLETELPYLCGGNVTQAERQACYDKRNIRERELVTAYWNRFLMLPKVKDCLFFVLEYCDGGGFMSCAMEHGDLFRLLPHIQISLH